MTPRSILKHHRRGSSISISQDSTNTPFPYAQCPRIDTQHVHFPRTPDLTTSQMTHSSTIYDRAPILVSPNICALPPRSTGSTVMKSTKRPPFLAQDYFHPDICPLYETEQSFMFSGMEHFEDPSPEGHVVPPLMSDHASSSSEDTDGSMSPFSEPLSFRLPQSPSDYPIPCKGSPEELDRALSFLPHAPGIKLESEDFLTSFPFTASKVPSRRRLRSKSSLKSSSFLAGSESVPDLEDDGCLGGF